MDEETDFSKFRFYLLTRSRHRVSAVDIHRELVVSWSQKAPALRRVQNWMLDFLTSKRDLLDDAERRGRPLSVNIAANIELIRQLIETDPFLSIRQMASACGISYGTTNSIRHENDYHHVSGLWVPHVLSPAHKVARVQCARSMIDVLSNHDNVESAYAVEDESWVYFDWHYHIGQKAWVHAGGDKPQLPKFNPMTPRKCLVVVCFSVCGRFHVKTLKYGETITSELFIDFLRRMAELWRKRRVNPIKFSSLLLQMVNARRIHPSSLQPI
jgi:hypothetical protein